MTSRSNPAAATDPDHSGHTRAGEDPASGHLLSLLEKGGTYRSIAQAAGVAAMTVHGIAAGRSRPQEHTTAVVQAVTAAGLARARVDAGGTRLRLRALHVMGHGSARIARAAGTSQRTVRALVRGDSARVSARLRDAVITVYDAWWDKRAPEGTRHERAAATTARRRAIAGNWCPPAALDDDELDQPGYRPGSGWRPARGTGPAHAFPRPVLERASRQPGRRP